MQSDLFGNHPHSAPANSTNPKKDFLERYRIQLRLDQAIVTLIALLVVYVLVFSFGVEKGKRFAVTELKAERAKREVLVRELQAKIFEISQSQALSANSSAPNPAVSGTHPPSKSVVNSQTESIRESMEDKNADAEETPVNGAVARPGGKFTIQIITFTSQNAAEREIKRLTAKGHQAFVIPSGKYRQVCVDAFDTRQKANHALGELKARGIVPPDAYVRALQ